MTRGAGILMGVILVAAGSAVPLSQSGSAGCTSIPDEGGIRPLLVLLFSITLPLAGAYGQGERLKSLRPGEKIWIDYSEGDKLHSAKAKASARPEDGLAVRLKRSEVVMARGDARKVEVYGGKSRAKGAGIGAAIGTPIGAGLYGAFVAANSGEFNRPGAVVAAGTAFIAGIGAVIGVAVGSTKKVTVYEAPKK